jgi:hypothetical protein
MLISWRDHANYPLNPDANEKVALLRYNRALKSRLGAVP